MATLMLHPLLDDGIAPTSEDFSGGVLVCNCTDRPVRVRVEGQVAHNHACGCTKCWKPEGAVFSIVAVAPVDKVTVLENGDKLEVVDPSALLQCIRSGLRARAGRSRVSQRSCPRSSRPV